jgi:hypothetical protein
MGETVLLHPGKSWIAGILYCLMIAWSISVAAQDNSSPRGPTKDAPASAETKEAAPRAVEEVQPSLYYLKDKQGTLQPVPNFTLEDLEYYYKLKHQLAQGDPRPRYVLQLMLATGSVNSAGQAELSIQFRVLVREDQWTRIPLRLDQAVLRETAQYQGPGEHVLSFEGDGAGYVAWVRGPAGQQHQFTLKVLVPLTTLGQETRLRLWIPRVTESNLKFKVPFAKAVARVSEAATLQTPSGDAKATELSVVGPSGDFEMSWHPADAAPSKAAALEAFGNIAVRLDGRGVETEAAFSVRSYGEAFDRFRIALPPDTELAPGNPSGYTLTVVEGNSPPSGPQRRRLVDVQLAKRTVGPVEVRLATKRAADTTHSENWLELAGFTFPDAARQWGNVAVSVAGDWQILWGTRSGVRQVEQLPDAVRRSDVAAAFEYFAPTSSLMARLVQRETRIGVEPEYVILVDGDQVRLEAKLRYTVRGAKVFVVNVAMPDWRIDEAGPDNIVAIDGVPPGAAGPLLSLPLASPTSGQFEIRLKAHLPLPPDAKSFSVVLPQPTASAPVAAVVAVLPADNIEIVPDSRTAGLLRQQVAVPLELPLRQQEPLFYRSDAPRAVFAAEMRRHRQKITASVASRATMDPTAVRVEQKFVYSIAYEPTDYFLLEVPRDLGGKGRLALLHEGQPLAPVVLGGDDGVKPLRLRVALPKACIGPCEIVARYSLPPATDAGGTVRVPLAMPLDVELAGNNVLVVPAAEQQIEVASGVWTAIEAGLGQAAAPRTREFSAAGRAAEIAIHLNGDAGNAAVVVDRAWFQTCVAKSAAPARQDRAVFQFTTRRRELEIALPDGAACELASVQLNGAPVTPRMRAGRVLVVPLSADAEPPRYYVLCLKYHFPGQRPNRGAMKFEFAGLGDDAWIRRAYWQLLLPAEEHLVTSPRDLTGEFAWGWNKFYFGRQPVLNQADLDAWCGLSHPGSAPVPVGMNTYLFSSLGTFGPCEIVTAGRSTIVFLSSALALMAGLLLIYVRATRHPAVLLAAAVILAGVTATYPELALIAVQASAIGLGLSLLAALLRYLTASGRQPQTPEVSSAVMPILQMPQPSGTQVPAAASAGSSRKAIVPLPPDAAT